MNRRSLLALLLALALGPSALVATAAHAEDGSDDDSSDDSGSDDGGSDDGGSDDGGSDDGGSDDGGSDDGGSDDGGSDDGGSDDGGSDDGGSDDGEDREDDHDDALRAVTAKDAIPLKQMLLQFNRQFDGTVVDVTLIRGTDSLRYRVKFIDSGGRVRRAYFDAVTGALVQ